MRVNTKNLSSFVLVLFLGFIVFGYAYAKSENLINGPIISLESPKETTVGKPLVEVKGKATNIVSINLNDRPISVDEQGIFSEKVLLMDGYNAIKLSAKDRFGRETEKLFELFYKNI